jgi:hypothetical protein
MLDLSDGGCLMSREIAGSVEADDDRLRDPLAVATVLVALTAVGRDAQRSSARW